MDTNKIRACLGGLQLLGILEDPKQAFNAEEKGFLLPRWRDYRVSILAENLRLELGLKPIGERSLQLAKKTPSEKLEIFAKELKEDLDFGLLILRGLEVNLPPKTNPLE